MRDRKPVGQQLGSKSGASGDMTVQSGLEQPEGEPDLPEEGMLEPGLQAYIGQQLRSVYDEVLNESIPDRLLALLQELEQKQADKS